MTCSVVRKKSEKRTRKIKKIKTCKICFELYNVFECEKTIVHGSLRVVCMLIVVLCFSLELKSGEKISQV
jgi:hypothetical protein